LSLNFSFSKNIFGLLRKTSLIFVNSFSFLKL
jgi:hypothetical protein